MSDTDRKFSIQEIREYLKGNLLMVVDKDCMDNHRTHYDSPRNFALQIAISELEDHEDGIAAVTDRVAGGAPSCDVEEEEHMFGDHIRRLIRIVRDFKNRS